MLIKTALVLLFLAMPVMAGDSLFWVDTTQLWPPHRDTTRYYIKEIKQKCDTIHKWSSYDCRKCRVACSALICTPQVQCVDDTIWADKVQVWLTPEQLSKLTKLLNLLHLTKTQEQIKGLLGEAPTKKLKE